MSILKRDYEISVWVDNQDGQEKRITTYEVNGISYTLNLGIIGKHNLTSQWRAFNPKLVSNINGTNTLTFDMYYSYIDVVTGESVNNSLTELLINERKIKLEYNGKWYDFLIKSSKKDSSKKIISYTATDQYINELSKNGFNIELAANLRNNLGTIKQLSEKVLEDTEWKIDPDSDKIFNFSKDHLLILQINGSFDGTIRKITQANLNTYDDTGYTHFSTSSDIPSSGYIGMFLSSCEKESTILQFIRFKSTTSSGVTYIEPWDKTTIDDSCYVLKDITQYFITDANIIQNRTFDPTYQLYIPSNCSIHAIGISKYLGQRVVFTPDIVYEPLVEKYITKYTQTVSGVTTAYAGVASTKYEAPELIQNYITNPTKYKSTSGWSSAFNKLTDISGQSGNVENIFTNSSGQDYFTALMNAAGTSNVVDINDFTSKIKFTTSNYKTAMLVNSGFFDNRKNIGTLTNGKKFVLMYRGNTKIVYKQDGIQTSSNGGIKVYIGQYQYQTSPKAYKTNNGASYISEDFKYCSYLKFTSFHSQTVTIGEGEEARSIVYQVAEATVENCALSEKDYEKGYDLNKRPNRIIVAIQPEWTAGGTAPEGTGEIILEDFQIFPYIGEDANGYYTPESQLNSIQIEKPNYKLYYYKDDIGIINEAADEIAATDITEVIPVYDGEINPEHNGYDILYHPYKKQAIDIKESNYFNIIQTFCEKFGCWAKFNIGRKVTSDSSERGAIDSTQKYIKFQNSIEVPNFSGIKYGVNLKGISRSYESKSLVNKLIVKQNKNTNGQNGYCSITRAPSNATGENYIYNFDYYLIKGIINEGYYALWTTECNNSDENWPFKLVSVSGSDEEASKCSYFVALRNINNLILQQTNVLLQINPSLMAAKAKVSEAEKGQLSCETSLEEAYDDFNTRFGVAYDKFRNNPQEIESNLKAQIKLDSSYLVTIIQLEQSLQQYKEMYAINNPKLETYQQEYDLAYKNIQALTAKKTDYNKKFFSAMSGYIQEGTWIDESYYLDENYYLDSLSTLLKSAIPQATYNIFTVAISALPEYSHFNLNLGDETIVEDSDFFGSKSDGSPITITVICTECTYNLDSPDKDSVKVQTFKGEFADLFKKITASVQQVKFAQGGYKLAAELADSDTKSRSEFLQEALNYDKTTIDNYANRTFSLDERGLTIEAELNDKQNLIRATNGYILLSEDGGESWGVAISPKGINANKINVGTINVENVNIMDGKNPTFRWDQYGLTAYEKTITAIMDGESIRYKINNINYGRGVRFDHLGIYGFTGKAKGWAPTAVVGYKNPNTNGEDCDTDGAAYNPEIFVRNASIFELTENGFYLNAHKGAAYCHIKLENGTISAIDPSSISSTVLLGKVDDILYNKWKNVDDEWVPYYSNS